MQTELETMQKSRDEWRRLALQFDAHRMEAIWLLRLVSANGLSEDTKTKIEAFLTKPPPNGNAIYEKIVKELSS